MSRPNALDILALIDERIDDVGGELVRRGHLDDEGRLTITPEHSGYRGACQCLGALNALDELGRAILDRLRPNGATIH